MSDPFDPDFEIWRQAHRTQADIERAERENSVHRWVLLGIFILATVAIHDYYVVPSENFSGQILRQWITSGIFAIIPSLAIELVVSFARYCIMGR